MTPTTVRKPVALYARLSVTTEESVSIDRQLEAGRRYAEARGWDVVVEEVDDGVSATKNKPEDRLGWRAVLDSPERFEAVIVWKVDRLARRVLDFLHADEALRERGAGLVAVEDPIDMTTAQGRAFATMLAVFGEMEAAAISARVKAARAALVQSGRRAGGRPPFGFMNVPNPEGPGYVLGQDPERIDIVRDLVVRTVAGQTLYGLVRWLEAEGVAPRQRDKRKSAARWHEAAVDSILRNPALAGLTPHRGDVVRNRDGLPVVDESFAVLTTEERRRLLHILDERLKPGSRTYRGEPSLLSGIVRCGTCLAPMHRGLSSRSLPAYRCANPECERRVTVSRVRVEEYVEGEFLRRFGRLAAHVADVSSSDPAELADIEAAITETTAALAQDDADVGALVERLGNLKRMRTTMRASAESATTVYRSTGRTFGEEWAATDDVRDRRDLIGRALAGVLVAPTSNRGNTFDTERVEIVLSGSPEAEFYGL